MALATLIGALLGKARRGGDAKAAHWTSPRHLTVSVVLAALCLSTPGLAADKIRMQLSWLPTADAGCIYQAYAQGTYSEANLDVEILIGGPQVNTRLLLLAGRVDVIIGSFAENAEMYAANDTPIIMAVPLFQKSPLVIVGIDHGDSEKSDLQTLLKGPIFMSAHSRLALWPELKARFGLSDDQVRQYTGALEPIIANKDSSVIGFVSGEPLILASKGIKPLLYPLADYGFDDYGYFLEMGADWYAKHKDLAGRFVNATIEGCRAYVGPDYAAAHKAILAGNPDLSPEMLDRSRKALIDYGIFGNASTMGTMTRARWRKIVDRGRDAGLQVDLDRVMQHVAPEGLHDE